MIRNLIRSLIPRLRASGTTIETLGHPAAGVLGWFGGQPTVSGVNVTESTALTFSAVWCATRVIAETLSCLPCVLYRKLPDGGRERADDDPRYWLMHDEPHPVINANTFFESLTAQVVLGGNCYGHLIYSGGGEVDRIDPILPEKVHPHVVGNTIEYQVDDAQLVIPSEDMLHVIGPSSDGLLGMSVVAKARESLGSAIAAEQMAAGQFGNSAMPTGALVVPGRMDRDKRDMLRREWEEIHRGAAKSGRVGVLHGGMDFKPFSMSNEDAQFLESRHFSIRDVARWFRVPPHMIGDLQDSSVRANIEQQAIEFIVYTMRPWLIRWEQALNRKLLTREERQTLYFEFLLDSLLRGDIAARYSAYSVARQWGWLSVNEIRKFENLNQVGGGDTYLQPVNMAPAGTLPQGPATGVFDNGGYTADNASCITSYLGDTSAMAVPVQVVDAICGTEVATSIS